MERTSRWAKLTEKARSNFSKSTKGTQSPSTGTKENFTGRSDRTPTTPLSKKEKNLESCQTKGRSCMRRKHTILTSRALESGKLALRVKESSSTW
jgi:hypothetical protein